VGSLVRVRGNGVSEFSGSKKINVMTDWAVVNSPDRGVKSWDSFWAKSKAEDAKVLKITVPVIVVLMGLLLASIVFYFNSTAGVGVDGFNGLYLALVGIPSAILVGMFLGLKYFLNNDWWVSLGVMAVTGSVGFVGLVSAVMFSFGLFAVV
jgi:hypothetical protein